MLRFRGLIIASAALAVLAGVIYWSNKKTEEDAKKAPETSPRILSINEDQIQQVSVQRRDTAEVVLARVDGKWKMTAPQQLGTDEESVRALFSALAALASDRLVDEKAGDLTPYGLNSPGLVVTVLKKDKKIEKLLIGDETPTPGAFFCKLESDPRVFTLATATKIQFDKDWRGWRDTRLLTADLAKVSRIELETKQSAIEFGRVSESEWQILKPKPMRADGWQLDELTRQLKNVKMPAEGATGNEEKSFAAATPAVTVKITDPAGMQSLEVRKDKDGVYWTRSSAVAGTYKLADDVAKIVTKGLEDFRNKKLFDFGFNDPSKLDLKIDGKQMVYEKKGEKWVSGPKEIDVVSVQNFIDKIRDLSATKFPEVALSAVNTEIGVTSNKAEKVRLGKQGEQCLGQRENEPTIYEIDCKSLDDLRKAAGDIKEPASDKKDTKKK